MKNIEIGSIIGLIFTLLIGKGLLDDDDLTNFRLAMLLAAEDEEAAIKSLLANTKKLGE